jgi:hypothetical protein
LEVATRFAKILKKTMQQTLAENVSRYRAFFTKLQRFRLFGRGSEGDY